MFLLNCSDEDTILQMEHKCKY